MGTLACLPFFYLLTYLKLPTIFLVIPVILLTCVSCYITENLQRELGLHDPSWIVFDEVLGMATTWIIVAPESMWQIAILFVLFRFFDIYKIWPASWLDKLEHGSGTILDDIVSGIFAGVFYLVSEIIYLKLL